MYNISSFSNSYNTHSPILFINKEKNGFYSTSYRLDKVTDELNLLRKFEDWSQVFSQDRTIVPKLIKISEPLQPQIILHQDIHNTHGNTIALFTDSSYICIISAPHKHTLSGLMIKSLKEEIKDNLQNIYQAIYDHNHNITLNLQQLFEKVCYNQPLDSTKLGEFHIKNLTMIFEPELINAYYIPTIDLNDGSTLIAESLRQNNGSLETLNFVQEYTTEIIIGSTAIATALIIPSLAIVGCIIYKHSNREFDALPQDI